MAERQESRLKRNLTFWNLMGVAIGQFKDCSACFKRFLRSSIRWRKVIK